MDVGSRLFTAERLPLSVIKHDDHGGDHVAHPSGPTSDQR